MSLPRAPACWQDLLAEQAGVLGRQQALAGGLTRHQWQRRLSSGTWQRALPGVAVAHTGGVSDEQLGWAAVLYGGESAALTGDAALRVWGLALPDPEPWRIAVNGRRLVAPQVLVQVHAPALLRVQPHRVVRLHELVHPVRRPPVLRPSAAVLHAAAWAHSDRAAEWRVAAAVQARIVSPEQLRATLQVLTRIRRRALVRNVLDDVELGAHARGELDFLAFLRRHDLPLPDRLQRPLRAGTRRLYLDAWWDRRRVAVEVDGAHHRLVRTWESDLMRSNQLAVSSRDDRVLLLRFTAGQLRHDEREVAHQLRGALL